MVTRNQSPHSPQAVSICIVRSQSQHESTMNTREASGISEGGERSKINPEGGGPHLSRLAALATALLLEVVVSTACVTRAWPTAAPATSSENSPESKYYIFYILFLISLQQKGNK